MESYLLVGRAVQYMDSAFMMMPIARYLGIDGTSCDDASSDMRSVDGRCETCA